MIYVSHVYHEPGSQSRKLGWSGRWRRAVKWFSGSTESCPLRALTLCFFDELAAGFDPIVVGVAGQREANATLRDEVGAETDFVVGRLDDLFGRGSFFGIGGCGAGRRFFPWNGGLLFSFPGRC